MAKDKPGAGWGTDCEAQLEYENDNYYLLTWDDPCCMEIRNTNQVISALGVSLVEDDSKWYMHNKVHREGIATRDIKELSDWLNAEQEGPNRVPSENFITDGCGYVWIRRILTKCE